MLFCNGRARAAVVEVNARKSLISMNLWRILTEVAWSSDAVVWH